MAYVGNDPVNATDPDGQESNPLYGMNSRGQPNAAARGCAGCGAKVAGGVADFTPVVGDIKGAVEFAQNPTPLGAVGVVVGVVPIVGDLGKAALKQTDEVVQLNKQLASEAQMSQLLDGGGTVFAGGDSGVVFRDAEKIAESLGDNVNASDLVKVKSDPHVTPDGMSLSTHAVRNEKTGEILEPKSIINERANR